VSVWYAKNRWEAWAPLPPFLGDEVTGRKTIAVIGTADRAGFMKKAVGFDVVFSADPVFQAHDFVKMIQEEIDRGRGTVASERSIIRYVSFDGFCGGADFVSLHVPFA
jgi:hypothetical protein